jgi:hypothetical protein
VFDDIAWIESNGTVRNVASLASHYGSPNGWAHAMQALEQVLSRARMRDLVWLEANARSVLGAYAHYGSRWGGIDPSDVPRLPGAAQRLATFHAKGHVREAAVRAVASTNDPDVIPYLLLRANDWVTQVSESASRALEGRLRAANAAAWIKALPLEFHVRALARRSLGHLFDKAREILVSPAASSALYEALRSGTADVRRACVSLAVSLPVDEQVHVLSIAVRDNDPLVASRAVVAFLERSSSIETSAMAHSLLHHRVAKVRSLAITTLWTHAPAEAFEPSRAALVDTARCVRAVAQFELRRHHNVDPAAIYLSILPTARGRDLLAVLAGLTESGSAEHAAPIARFVEDVSPRVQCAALRALSRLDGDAYAGVFVAALQSPAPRVARVGREALEARAHLVERATLDALLNAGGAPARAVLTLLPQLDYWGSLLAALRAVADPDLRETAHRVIERLVARQTYSLPADHATLESAFASVRENLSIASRVEALLELTRPRVRR